MKKNRKPRFIVEKIDEDILALLVQQTRRIFLEDLQNSELKYQVENIAKYAHYLIDKLTFPIKATYEIDNGMFGKELQNIKIEKLLPEEVRQGLKCLCSFGSSKLKIPIHKINISEEDKEAKYEIERYVEWYNKNH